MGVRTSTVKESVFVFVCVCVCVCGGGDGAWGWAKTMGLGFKGCHPWRSSSSGPRVCLCVCVCARASVLLCVCVCVCVWHEFFRLVHISKSCHCMLHLVSWMLSVIYEHRHLPVARPAPCMRRQSSEAIRSWVSDPR